jgi:adenylate kinase
MQILFLGAPGAGKGTQCKRLAPELGLAHLSSGDLLREAVKLGTEAGKKAKSYMDQGILVPDDVLIAMFADKLSAAECARGFILDGFPRNLAQAEALDKLLTDIKKEMSVVLNVDVDDNLLTERIAGRMSCSNKDCATPYHRTFMKPKVEGKCDKCSSELTRRSDDKVELVAARLKTYYEQTEPLIEYYEKRGLLKTVNGNKDPDTIFGDILKALKKNEQVISR